MDSHRAACIMQVCTSSLPLGSRRRRARDNCFCGRRSEQTHRSCPRHPLSQHSPPPRAHNCKHTMAQQLLVRQQQAACAGASCSGRRCSLRPAPLGRTAAVQGLPSYAPRARVVPRSAAIDGYYSKGPDDFVMATAEPEEMSAADIKAALLDSLYGTERGLAARSEVRAEISELITQLEARNPTPSPTDMMALLDGSWKLVYTSNSELLAILALSRLPFVSIGDISQRVDTAAASVENTVSISVPLSSTSVSTRASFEVRSPKRLQVRFERGVIATPQLLADVEVPASVSVLGQEVDLSAVRSLLSPVSQGLSGIISQVGSLLAQSPDLSFPINTDRAQTWLLTTYLDDDTRITRGDGGSVFILVKDAAPGSPAAPPAMSAEQQATAEAMML